jgi:transposase
MSDLKPKHFNGQEKTGNGVDKLIREVRQKTRRQYTPEEKIRIVMEGIRGDDAITDLCRREGIHVNLYYKWLKDFMEAGKARLKGAEKRGATREEVDDLKRENARLKELVAEISLQNMILKKSIY